MKHTSTENINSKRMKILAKNYVRRCEAGDYIGVCQQRGRQTYDSLKSELEAKGIKVNPIGISVEVFNDYLGITTEKIIELAKIGL